jgi:hypothetical protein
LLAVRFEHVAPYRTKIISVTLGHASDHAHGGRGQRFPVNVSPSGSATLGLGAYADGTILNPLHHFIKITWTGLVDDLSTPAGDLGGALVPAGPASADNV